MEAKGLAVSSEELKNGSQIVIEFHSTTCKGKHTHFTIY